MLQRELEEEVDSKVGTVEHFSDSSAASEQAGKPALAIDDSRARVARPGEGTRLGVARQDGCLLRHLTGLALEVDPGERTDGVEASDGEVGGLATLDDHNARVVVVVEGLLARPSNLLVTESCLGLEETVSRILERRRVGGVKEHPGRELVDGDGRAQVDDVSDEVGRVDFGIVDLNHYPVLREPFLPDVEADGVQIAFLALSN